MRNRPLSSLCNLESSPLQWLKEGPMMAVHGWIGAKSLFQKTVEIGMKPFLINQDGEYMTRVIGKVVA